MSSAEQRRRCSNRNLERICLGLSLDSRAVWDIRRSCLQSGSVTCHALRISTTTCHHVWVTHQLVVRRLLRAANKKCDILANMHLKTMQQTAFERFPNLEKACTRMPRDVLEQKQADYTYTLEMRTSSGPASLHPGQSTKERNILIYIRHSP